MALRTFSPAGVEAIIMSRRVVDGWTERCHSDVLRASGAGNVLVWLAFAAVGLSVSPAAGDMPVSFQNDVMAVLSKAGCNQGVCHGNQNGKNGFKLSLRGEDPEFDLAALTRDMAGRRVNGFDADSSLILLKPTAQIPHEGGQRFAVDSTEYRVLKQWIADGARPDPTGVPKLVGLDVAPRKQVLVAPEDRVSLSVTATFSDGTARDVTRLAVYETSNQVASVTPEGEVRRASVGEGVVLVRYLDRQVPVELAFVPARPDFAWSDPPEVNLIDRHVFAKLRTLRIEPSALCSDTVFLRRAYLDTLGMLPTVEETRGFLADDRLDKRDRLIDRLLLRSEFADYWALKWSDLLRSEEKVLDRKGVQALHHWVRRSIAEGKPLDAFARELIAGRGSTYQNPPANYYRANRDPTVAAETTAQLFLGIRLQCARCHNHPFDRWTQDDYYGLAAFFARVRLKVVANSRLDRLDQHEFDGEQVIWIAREGEVVDPRTGGTTRPRFPDAAEELSPGEDRLEALADWIASPDNPYFARMQANRIWYHLMGRGIVDAIDDFRATNPPSNAALLDALADDFVSHGFDLRHLVRTILRSRTYQLSSEPNETNRDDAINFSHALVKPLEAEQLLDAVAQVAGVPVKFNGYPLGTRAGGLPGVRAFRRRDRAPTGGEMFLQTFGKPERLLACECERSDDTTLGQALQLISGPVVNEVLAEDDNRIGRLLAEGKSTAEIIDELYYVALSRPPNDAEREAAGLYVAVAQDRRAALEDVLWGLLNAKEFLLRR